MFALDKVVPWGRSFEEYQKMFALSAGDLSGSLLGCADGPASFNAEATRRGTRVISCDPLYQFDRAQISERIAATYDQIMMQTRLNADEFVWTNIHSVEELGRLRSEAMAAFLSDYDAGKHEGRYVSAILPTLPFEDREFDLAICSHFLFLYSDQLGEAFHLAAIHELCRVAKEVRIFPLLALGARPSPHVSTVTDALQSSGHRVTVETVPYEFQRGGNQMMRIRSCTAYPTHASDRPTASP
jgi:hypothetical protein